MSRSKNWCFTINNWTEDDVDQLMALDVSYLIVGKEGKEKTPHLQGYMVFKKQMCLKGVKKLLPRAHLEQAHGTSQQASDYCKKEGDWKEIGVCPVPPAQREKDRYQVAWELAQAGKIQEIEPSIRFRCYHTCKEIQKDFMKKPDDLKDVCGVWIYGSAGTGKTTHARKVYPDAYIKDRTKWWDGYQGEEHVILDDLDKFQVALGGYLKDWADKWTFKAEIKGGYLWIRPSVFVVTSQYAIDDIFVDVETRQALHRRFKEINSNKNQLI